ncbi:MAG: zinc ribbon domain-containing protein [Gemmatimonadetes bacterium]|nr:zinc ribbon domain-containing protein [Gemmatimonadota bacterium]
MPTYEYRCASGHTFELFQRMTDAPIDACPTCGAPAERLLSAGAGLLFKGSGFYITDYRSDAYRKAAASESGGGDSGAAAADAGGDAKARTEESAKSADAPKKASPKSDGGDAKGGASGSGGAPAT